jgi:hypothetical protein
MTDDEKISQRYRELGAEEPPRALDDAILAAARRGRQRWYAPLAAAAVLVLAVAVTLHMQVEQPDVEARAPRLEKQAQPAAQAPAKAPADIVAKAAPDRAKPKVEALAKLAEPRTFVPDPLPSAAPAAAPAPAASASGAVAGLAGERDMRADRAYERARPPAAGEAMGRRAEAPTRSLAETPERELERIAELRGMGRHDEADRALAEFRKRYPEYRIPEEMRLRVERR